MLARKPLDGTTAQNVRAFGVGGLNVEACAIDGDKRRWPANVVLHEETARELNDGAAIGDSAGLPGPSRFFYVAKADRRERDAGLSASPERNTHPTVKPIALMRHLVRLVTPPGGIVLDPFMGSGTTGIAAILEGVGFVGIDRDASHVAIANARIKFWVGDTLAEAA